jgi:hypothetical protein
MTVSFPSTSRSSSRPCRPSAAARAPRLRSRALAAAFAACFAALAILVAPSTASAQSIIEQPGRHRDYGIEVEPHLALGLGDGHGASDGIGGGLRLGIPLVKNGFVSTINNGVALGIGVDWLHYSVSCGFADCWHANRLWVPIVLQWNFYLSPSWSVFAEGGLTFSHGTYGGGVCYGYGPRGDRFRVDCDYGGSRNDLDPVVAIGARWQFAQSANLVARLGWPYVTIGASFW